MLMDTQRQLHPTQQQLAAFALGKLAPDVRARMQKHLEHCAACTQALADTPADTLMALLQKARSPQSQRDQSTPGVRDSATMLGGDSDRRPRAAGQSAPDETDRVSQRPVGMADIPEPLRQQSKYRIVRLIGRGGMGAVYEAYHERMDRRVALKIIHPALLDHPEALERFDQEVRAAAKLEHPNVARAYDADDFGSMCVLVVEFISGMSLDRFLEKNGPLAVPQACRCIRQALAGLQEAHRHHMVHRDLKPQNLMLTPKGIVKILDFGLAKVRGSQRGQLTREQALMGTPHYMAPEQALDAAQADIRADIYSLGCTLYYLLTGAPPFNDPTEMKVLLAHQREQPRMLHEVRPDVPRELSDVVARMLEKDPAKRPQTPDEASRELRAFTVGQTVDAVAKPLDPIPAAAIAGQAEFDFALPDAAPSVRRRGGASQPQTIGKLSRRAMWMTGAVSLLSLLLLFAAWLSGMFLVETPHGTIVVDNVPPGSEVLIGNDRVRLTGGGDTVTIETVPVGQHRLRVVQNDNELWADDVRVKFAGELVRLSYIARVKPVPPLLHPTLPAKLDSFEAYLLQGDWSIQGPELVQSALGHSIKGIYFGDRTWTNYDYSCEFNATSGNRGLVYVAFNGENMATHRVLRLGVLGDSTRELWHFYPLASPEPLISAQNQTIEPGQWHRVRVAVRGAECRCYLDDEEIAQEVDERYRRGAVGLGTWNAAVRFRNIRVTSPNGGAVYLAGLPKLPQDRGIFDPQRWTISDPLALAVGPSATVIAAGEKGNYVMSQRNDFRDIEVEAELSGSKNTDAWLIVRGEVVNGGWTGITYDIFDDGGGSIAAGMQFHSFREQENGIRHVRVPLDTPFRLKLRIVGLESWIDVNGETTSGVNFIQRHELPMGAVGFRVSRGELTVRRFIIREIRN